MWVCIVQEYIFLYIYMEIFDSKQDAVSDHVHFSCSNKSAFRARLLIYPLSIYIEKLSNHLEYKKEYFYHAALLSMSKISRRIY